MRFPQHGEIHPAGTDRQVAEAQDSFSFTRSATFVKERAAATADGEIALVQFQLASGTGPRLGSGAEGLGRCERVLAQPERLAVDGKGDRAENLYGRRGSRTDECANTGLARLECDPMID